MRRHGRTAAITVSAVLFLCSTFAVRPWVEGWVQSEQFDVLTGGYLSLLLMGLVSLAALIDWIRRRRRGDPPLWWQPLARAFAGASLFFAAALLSGLPLRLAHPVSLLGRCVLWNDHLRFLFVPRWSDQITLLLVTAGMVCLLRKQSRWDGLTRSTGRETWQRLAGFLLLVELAVTLQAAWIPLTMAGPYLLLGPLGYESGSDFFSTGWYRGSSGPVWPGPRDVAQALDLFAGVALLLWLFQNLWGRAMQGRAITTLLPPPITRP
jgi:hypothetical protein